MIEVFLSVLSLPNIAKASEGQSRALVPDCPSANDLHRSVGEGQDGASGGGGRRLGVVPFWTSNPLSRQVAMVATMLTACHCNYG